MRINLIVLISIVLFSLALNIDCHAESTLESAEAAYKKGDYSTSASIYDSIIKEKGVSSALLANAGNAYMKCGDYGKALLYYERSLRLNPSDNDVKANISYINAKVQDNNRADAKGKKVSVSPDEKGFFKGLRDRIITNHTSNTWAVWGVIFFILFCSCLVIYITLKNVLLRKIGFFGGLFSIFLCILMIISASMSQSYQLSESRGVITGYKINLLTEPISNAKANSPTLNRGTLMDIIGEETGSDGKTTWYKVRLNSDYVGWIKSTDFEVI